jgi:copper chaperone CopZ
MQTTITITGTHCKACKMLIEDVCKEVPGVKSCNVDFETGKTEIGHDENLNWDILQKEIENLGEYKIKNNN